MVWKSLILFFSLFLLLVNITFSQPFGPPLYIANPDTLECRYYFAGNPKHFNPRPENYTINIGYTTDFKDLSQACELYRCTVTNGKILLKDKDDASPDVCWCPEGTKWNNESGCIEEPDYLKGAVFGPPVYIANPETLECRYYFAGNPKHFNPRPENYSDNIGYTTDFKNQSQACQLYKCLKTNGRVLLTSKDDSNPNLCECPLSTIWNNESGCAANIPITGLAIKEQDKNNFFARLLEWIAGLFR